MSPRTKPGIVFVHGIWADASCFSKVIPTLQAEGYEVMAMGATIHDVDSRHVPMLSNPGPVIDVIRTAALAVG